MDMSSALYVAVLALSLGLVLFQHWARSRKGRILLISAVLGGFVVIAATHALASAVTVGGQVMAALGVLFGAQGATASLVLLWREMEADLHEQEPETDREAA
ncbi:MAG TPA: hypothetical protein ENN01_02265 [Halothiobacillus sp.]|nr:hypothetical protein [Halothiobacillus sp.]